MTKIQNTKHKRNSVKQYDLEDRTYKFAKDIRIFVKKIQRTISNIEDGKQLIRSSGSVGANYIEANEALSKKDFIHRIKISRKEAKESRYWLKLINIGSTLESKQKILIQEATELMKIFGKILENSK